MRILGAKIGRLVGPFWLALALGACGSAEPNNGEDKARAQREQAVAARLKSACSSQATYDRLKQVAFDEAIRIRNANSANLDTLSTHSLVRVENPRVKSRDETLDVTVCSGRFILQVPPGAERAFDGQRQLTADIEYAAQAAADGSGLVYQIRGAEPIVYRLATFDLQAQAYRPRSAATPFAHADPVPADAANDTAAPARSAPRATPVESTESAPVQAATDSSERTQRPVPITPSFNCRIARSRSERMVCGNDRLASLDRQMSSQFYSALSRGDERVRSDLRRTRDSFLRNRERCGDPRCVEQAYLDRMDEISDIAAGR